MGRRPKILNKVNWTPTLLFVSGVKSAETWESYTVEADALVKMNGLSATGQNSLS